MVKAKKIIIRENSVKMAKGKSSTIQRMQDSVDEVQNEMEGYDSMIENGTSEESNSENGQEVDVNGEDSDSDDGFSDKEEVKPLVKLDKNANKRKLEPTPQKDIAQNKKSKTVSEKAKAPTLEEINEMKETRNLFHSNIFRLQVKEMLQETKVKDKYTNYINSFLGQFGQFLKGLKNMANKESIDKLSWLKQSKISVPLNLESLKVEQQKNFHFLFIKPYLEPFLLGACNTHTLLGPKLEADIGVVMPAECWQKDNYLNLQYDQKRALYLTYITQKLLESKSIPHLTANHLKYNYYNNNPLKPVLVITPPQEAGKQLAQKLSLRIFVVTDPQSFKLNRFVPWNTNIRSTLFGNNGDEDDTAPFATPSYNANVLFDLTMQQNQSLLHEVFEQHKNFQEGLILLKVWLRQRQLDVGFSGFSAHILAMFIVYLFKQRKLHSNMSSYQVARNVWNHLAFSLWNEESKGITLCKNTNSVSNQPTLEQFHTYYPVVFIDVTGFYNICSNISVAVYKRICLEAKLAVDMLNDMKFNSFQYLFLSKLPLYTQVDHLLKINKPDAVEQILEMHVNPADKHNYVGHTYPLLLNTVTSLLQKGLSKRVDCMIPLEQLTLAWNINELAVSAPQYLHLGLILNSENAYEIIDKASESTDEAAKFRALWGEKAQLRRFQDGSITESVVWAGHKDTLSKKRLIVRSIVLYLLQHHFQLEEKDVEYIGGEFDTVFELTKGFKVENLRLKKTKIMQDTNAEEMALQVVREFDDLARKLNNLRELPLEIVSIGGISPVLRYCEPQPILPRARCINKNFFADHIQYGVIQLGQSSKWADELGAMRALKTAFYIQIAKLLQEKHNLLCKVSYDGVLVLKEGYCFNLEIAHPKEVALLKKEKTDKGITTYVDCPESIALEKRHYILPKVTGTLKALYQNYSSFGPTVMIAKRWLYCQLIDNGLWPEECTELLVASQYINSTVKCITNSPQIGFIRFLQLLAHTDWKSQLFLLNFNGALDESDISELEQRFSTDRDAFPPLCIVTSYDQKLNGKLWSSEQQPNVRVLAKVTLMARQSLEIIESTLLSLNLTLIKPAKIFKAPTEGYDLLIQLNPDNVPNCLAFEFGSSFVDFTKPNWHMPLAGSNFLENAISKLREAYADYAAFFYNPCGGKEIAIIWKPNAFNAKEFKVSDVNGCSITADHKHIQAKKEVLIEDFKFILQDFYLRMGTLEFVRETSRNQKVNCKQVKPRYYITADSSNQSKDKDPVMENKPAATKKQNLKNRMTTKYKAKSKEKFNKKVVKK